MKLQQLLHHARDAKNVMMRMLLHPDERVRDAFLLVCEEQGCDVDDLTRALHRYPEGGG